MNCIIAIKIHSNFVKITIIKFGHLIDDLPSRLMLQLKLLMTMFPVHGLMVDMLSHEQVTRNSCVNVDMKQIKLIYNMEEAHQCICLWEDRY
jgi:hypothetical protein